MKTLKGAKTNLEKFVQSSVNSRVRDYDGDVTGFVYGVLNNGCQSGIVGELVYYKDTLAFFKRHKKAIQSMLVEWMNETGAKNPSELFGDKWDENDYFAEDTQNQNLLAWFAYEETLRNLASRNRIGVN